MMSAQRDGFFRYTLANTSDMTAISASAIRLAQVSGTTEAPGVLLVPPPVLLRSTSPNLS